MGDEIIQGVVLTPLIIIPNPKGDLMRVLRAGDSTFGGFGEAYFTSVKQGVVKGWKLHRKMKINLIVPVGMVGFYIKRNFEDPPFYCEIGSNAYFRLTIEPNLWVAFKGISEPLNLILNISDLIHDPSEQINIPYI